MNDHCHSSLRWSFVIFSHCQRLVFLPMLFCFIHSLTDTFIYFISIFLFDNIFETLNTRNSFLQFTCIYYYFANKRIKSITGSGTKLPSIQRITNFFEASILTEGTVLWLIQLHTFFQKFLATSHSHSKCSICSSTAQCVHNAEFLILHINKYLLVGIILY